MGRMVKLQVETVTLPPDDEYPLFVTANRYWDNGSALEDFNGKHRTEDKHPEAGLTLICLHSTSFHKETWEACLQTLFGIAKASLSVRGSATILEAWSIEAPNHGDSASLNWDALQRPPFSTHFGCEGYSEAVQRFLTKGKARFDMKNLVGVGHSLGANAILLIQNLKQVMPFKSLVIVEPMKRRDAWTTIDEARASLPGRVRSRKRGDGKREWDDRVVEAFLRHGIRSSPNSADPPMTAKFVLACTKEQEIVMYQDKEGSEAPVRALDQISYTVPVHLILGEVKDYVPREVHEVLTGPAPGRKFASVKILPHVGHLVPQEQPDALAKAIAQALRLDVRPRCKL